MAAAYVGERARYEANAREGSRILALVALVEMVANGRGQARSRERRVVVDRSGAGRNHPGECRP
jgi:hypothetical protein